MMKNRVLLVLSLIFMTSGMISAQTTQPVKRTITNEDLEKYRQSRLKAEADYRAKYKELGMPSPEELEARDRESRKQMEELSERLAYERQQANGSYQSRANDLRNQIISIDAQIDYLNGQIGSLPQGNNVFLSPGQVYSVGVLPRGNYRGGGRNVYQPRTTAVNPASSVQAAINAAAGAPNPFYGTPLYPSSIKVVVGPTNNVYRGGRGGYGGYYGGYPVVSNNNSYQRTELVSRLQYLQQVRAGLMAQWNQLTDEARRAGVRID